MDSSIVVPMHVHGAAGRASDATREGRQVCIDIIQEIRSLPGVSGIHLMAYRQEDSIPEIIDASGVLRGRIPWYPGRDPDPTSNRILS